ncbi:MAG: M16 family metallopeptidase [Chthoniobacterales bacterium]|jgi:zinc protease
MRPAARRPAMQHLLPDPDPAAAALVRGRTLTRVLPNGFTVLVEPDHSAPVASVQVWVQSGSIHEGTWLGAGLSHLLEHMIFKGTAKRGPNEIARAVQESGGYVNAYTSFDRTVYWIDVPAEGAATAIELLADASLHSTLPEAEFAKEQEVIRREFAMGFDDPNRMSTELMLSTAFTASPYKHPIIGHLEIFNRLTRDDLAAYYRARYTPENMFLVVTGDVDPARVFADAEQCFGSAPRQAQPPVFIPREPPQLGHREAHEEFDTELTRCSIVWHIPPVTHPDTAPLDVLATVLGAGRSTPLHRELREKQNLVHHISSYSYMAGEMGLFGIDFLCDPEKRVEAERAVRAIVERYRAQAAAPEEVTKARKSILADQLNNLSTARGRASDIGGSWLLARNPDLGSEYLEQVARVEAADLQRVARHYLGETRSTVTSLNPKGSRTRVAQSAPAVGARRIVKFALPNGLRVLVCPDNKLPLVNLVAVFRGGLLAETEATNGVTALAARTLIKGTEKRTADQLNDEIEAVGGQIRADSGNNSFSVSVEVMKPDLRLGMDILSDVLTHAEFPPEEIAREKEDQLASIKAEDEQITTVARHAMRQAVFGAHPYGLRSNGTEASVAALTRGQLVAFRDECVTAKNGVLAVFGDVSVGEVEALAGQFFGALPAGELLMTDPPVAPPLASAAEVVVHEPKQQAVLMAGFRGADALSPDRVGLELIDTASSDMASRFFHRIREELGLAYFVGASQMMGFAPGIFTFYLGTDPAKVDQVRKNFDEEIASLAAEGLTAAELARAKKKLIGSEAIRNQSLEAFAHVAAVDELYGLGADHHEGRAAEINAVTLEQIRDLAHKYFRDAHRATVLVTPGAPDPVAAG